MKIRFVILGAFMMACVLLLLAATPPAPIQRNQFSTNIPGASIIGNVRFASNVVVDSFIGAGTTNFTSPASIVFGTNPPGGYLLLSLPLVPNTTNGNFSIVRESSPFNPTNANNESVSIGWNIGPGGTRPNLLANSVWLQMESDYTPIGSTNNYVEIHYDLYDQLGNIGRPWGLTIDTRNIADWREDHIVTSTYWQTPITQSNYLYIATNQILFFNFATGYSNGLKLTGDGGTMVLSPITTPSAQAFSLAAWPNLQVPGASLSLGGSTFVCDVYMQSGKTIRFYRADNFSAIDMIGTKGITLANDRYLMWGTNGAEQNVSAGLRFLTNGSLQVVTGRDTTSTGSLVTSNLTAVGALIVGPSGANITNILTGRAVLDFPSTAASTSSDLSISVTGTTTNDVATVQAPPVVQLANGGFACFASNNTVYVRFMNYQTVGALDPGAASFSVIVHRF